MHNHVHTTGSKSYAQWKTEFVSMDTRSNYPDIISIIVLLDVGAKLNKVLTHK